MSWDRINQIGWRVEHFLAWTVLVAMLIVGLVTLLRAEWALVPAAARTQILCSEVLIERANLAPLTFADGNPAASDAALQHDTDDAPSRHCAPRSGTVPL